MAIIHVHTELSAYDEPDMFNEPYPALSSVFRKRLKKSRHYELPHSVTETGSMSYLVVETPNAGVTDTNSSKANEDLKIVSFVVLQILFNRSRISNVHCIV